MIVAHLGNGASMAAVRGGKSVDTTMGLTPAGGLMMGTRSGDLDPGVLLYLLGKGRSPSTVDYLVNQRSGLIGVSGSSSDMRDLLEPEASDPHAAQAIEMFCYQARKFSRRWPPRRRTGYVGLHRRHRHECPRDPPADLPRAGVPGHSPRRRPQRSQRAVISPDGSPVTVRVMKTDEELMIARHTCKLLRRSSSPVEEKTAGPA